MEYLRKFHMSVSSPKNQQVPCSYVYDPLPVKMAKPIRLLYLDLYLTSSGDFRGELRVHDLETAPSFRAIAYVWGDPTVVCKIETSEGYIGVTRSLADALDAFDGVNHYLAFWADAVCINQSDPLEKAQ